MPVPARLFWTYDLETERPELMEIVTAVSGLTATGKTTTLCRRFSRMPREKSEMIGDDGGTVGLKAVTPPSRWGDCTSKQKVLTKTSRRS